MLINLYPIKTANGLLWYAIDYLRDAPAGTTIICRAEQANLIKSQLPRVNVVAGNRQSLAKYLLRSLLRRTRLISFTPHPIPLHRDQIVIVHDDFPFLGRLGSLKRVLFRIGVTTSRCRVGYINRSNALRFVDFMGVRADRRFFCPNRTPLVQREVSNASEVPDRVVVGLFGTDSPKKQYHELFESAMRLGKTDRYVFRIYGGENAYTDDLRMKFPAIKLEVVNSSTVSMLNFLCTVNLAVSSSVGEGFGRPLAMALTLGIPTFLLESDTFREFFHGAAFFYPDIDDLWSELDIPRGTLVQDAWKTMQININQAADKAAASLWDAQ